MSLPYHLGNGWFGGFLPSIAFALIAYTGDIYSGLWYPIGVCLVSASIGTFFLRETRGVETEWPAKAAAEQAPSATPT